MEVNESEKRCFRYCSQEVTLLSFLEMCHYGEVVTTLTDLIRYFREKPRIVDSTAGAAVAVLLKDDDGDLQVLLVKRATRLTDPWSGHMAFPGGRRSKRDADLRETVMRETVEETRIDLNECQFLGTLNSLNSNVVQEMCVLPFVFSCDKPPKITLNEELCAYYWVSLDELRKSKGWSMMDWGEVPSYLVAGEVVWGLTYRMLEQFFSLISCIS